MNKTKIEFGFGAGMDKDQIPVSPECVKHGLDWIKKVTVRLFDGYTLTACEGGWRNPAGLLVEEPGFTLTIYTSFTPSVTPTKIDIMVDAIKQALRQEAVCVIQTPVNFEIL